MKIVGVTINNWKEPGEKWWQDVKARPNEPLIEATITFTLSWAEYEALIAQERRGDVGDRGKDGGES